MSQSDPLARARKALEILQDQQESRPGGAGNRLWHALQACMRLDDQVEIERARLRAYQQRVESEALKRYIDYQVELMERQIERARAEAERRLLLLASLDSPAAQAEEMKRCAIDTIYWFNNWAWTIDPRPDAPLQQMPFVLFDFQREMVEWIDELTFLQRQNGLVEKSRDMGVSWVVCCLAVKDWLFRPHFDQLFGSRKEDLVDSPGEMDSLFEKMRYQVDMLPAWMLPKGFDRKHHATFMKLFNPVNRSTITGESSNPDFARAGRYGRIILDEYAAFPEGGFKAWAACSQSARTILPISTPQGMFNMFAELRWQTDINVLTLHWQRHPWKDDRWYEGQKRTMKPALLAQEVDIDYEASQPGKIFTKWSAVHSVITWSEFAAHFGDAARDHKGAPMIPAHWQLGMALDWGSTESHPCAVIWVARPGEGDRLRDCVFIYREYIAPTGDTPREVALAIRRMEAGWREHERMTMRLMSHEAKSERDTFLKHHALPFEAWDTDYNAGIGQLMDYMQIRHNMPHPFRNLTGRPRLFLIAADEQGQSLFDKASAKWVVQSAVDSRGFARLRMEIPKYHYPESEQGKPVQQRRPFKRDDDAIDALRALAAQWFPQASALSADEVLERTLPSKLRREALADATQEGFGSRWLSRQLYLSEREEKHDEGGEHWRRRLYRERD